MQKTILHCDINNFYASVECILDPSLKDKAMAVCGDPNSRHGVVLAKNDIAKKYGIKTGDVVWEAKQKAPNLEIVVAKFDHYLKYTNKIVGIYNNYTCLCESFGADECWLDVTGSTHIFGDGETIANELRRTVTKETGLTISVGVSFNKIFAKLGSDLKKPNATTLLTRENFESKIYHLPCRELMGVGFATEKKLHKLNIFTIGDLANAPLDLLKQHFGVVGVQLGINARGQNSDPVREFVNTPVNQSVGHGMTTIRDITTLEDAYSLICYLADKVAARVRKQNARGFGVSISIRDHNLYHIGKQTSLNSPTNTSIDIANAAYSCLKELWNFTPLRTITVSIFNLQADATPVQLDFFDAAQKIKNENLEKTLDKIRKKHGATSIARANLIEKDFLYDKSDAEDFLPFRR